MLFLSSIFFIPCLQGVIYLMESSGQKRGRISSVVEASSSAPTPPKKEYDINKKDKRIKVSHADERLCNEFRKCIIDEELVKLSKDMF